jgi:hypothetical protein
MRRNSSEPPYEVERLEDGGVVVDVSRQEYSTYRLGHVIDLRKLLCDLSANKRFMLITPSRGIDVLGPSFQVRDRRENERKFMDIQQAGLTLLDTRKVS